MPVYLIYIEYNPSDGQASCSDHEAVNRDVLGKNSVLMVVYLTTFGKFLYESMQKIKKSELTLNNYGTILLN
ncbi:hypothetical protein C7R92_08350 [Brevibacillus porteri]|uniref:Uncharacterized protein n=1 Tax=Brevibacillus porteri TaxID=2126350 RepID=A0ABX5FSF5_9BACL|nr:hypothetical protein C7R92_08350 [Brevibacillus porteri]